MTRATTERTVLRFQVPDRGTLERLVDAPIEDAAADEAIEIAAFRDVYFDTPAQDLKAKGATLSIRQRQDGTATLRLDVLERLPEDGVPRRRHSEARIASAERSALLSSDAEPVRMLRALIDPERLKVRRSGASTRGVSRRRRARCIPALSHRNRRHGDLTGS